MQEESSRRLKKEQKMSKLYNMSSSTLSHQKSIERTAARPTKYYSTSTNKISTVRRNKDSAKLKISEKIDKKIDLVIAKHRLHN